ncbi:MAG: hypothetical protein ACI8RD_011295 [Bacillariaceae sp.]|jgi:hypothetical protein
MKGDICFGANTAGWRIDSISYQSNRRSYTYLGALIFSNVKITSGAFPLGVCAFPSRITVSPLKTLLTRATPLEGRIIGGRETGGTVAIFVFLLYLFYISFIDVVQVCGKYCSLDIVTMSQEWTNVICGKKRNIILKSDDPRTEHLKCLV